MGFQHPEQREHKLAGLRAAIRSPKTPEHLRPHLEKLAGPDWVVVLEEDDEPRKPEKDPWSVLSEEDGEPAKGDRVKLPDGREATVHFVHAKMRILRVKTDDGKKITVRAKTLKPIS